MRGLEFQVRRRNNLLALLSGIGRVYEATTIYLSNSPVSFMVERDSFHDSKSGLRSLLVPLLFAEAYLFATFLMFWVTPLRDEAVGLGLLSGFVVACNLAFFAGYCLFLRKLRVLSNRPLGFLTMTRMRWVIGLAIVWTIVFWVQYYRDAGDNTSLLTRLAHPGDSYLMRRQILLEGVADDKPINRLGQLELCSSVLGFCLPVFGILVWSKLGWFLKSGVLFAMLSVVVVAWATGTNEPSGHLAILVVCALLIRNYGRWPRARTAGLSIRGKLQIAVAGVGIIFAFVLFMGYNLEDRVNARKGFDPRANAGDFSSLSFLPQPAREALSMVWFYPTHGYCGLSYALQTPFEWTQGVGSSRGIQAYLKDYLGVEGILERTYPFRAESNYDWPAGGYWWTMYPWLASDITFPGVILFMFGLGWAFAKTWYESTRLNDPIAGIVFALIFMTIAFEPANVQMLISKQGVWTVFGALLMYGLSRMLGRSTDLNRQTGLIN